MDALSTIFECCIKAYALDADTLKAMGLEGERVVDGPVASHKPDEDDEILTRDGVWKGLDTFNVMGRHVDWEHQYRKTLQAKYLIGQGVKTYQDSDKTPRLATKLFKGNPFGDDAWDLLTKGGELGYSVEAKATSRDPKNPKRITGLKIYRVTLASSPMGHDSRVRPISTVLKSLDTMEGDLLEKGWLEESRFDDAIATLEELNVVPPSVRTIQQILINKAYTTGATIVGIGDEQSDLDTVSALRKQHMVGDKSQADYIQAPMVERKPQRKSKKDAKVEALITKGVDPGFATTLISHDLDEDQVMAAWQKLMKLKVKR